MTIASVPLGLLYSILLARALGPSARGDYATFVTLVGMLVGILSLGQGIVARAEIASDPTRARGTHANLVWFVLALAVVLIAAGGLVPAVVSTRFPGWIGVPVAICAAAAIYTGYGALVLQGLGSFRWVNALRLGRTAADLVSVSIFLVLLGLGLNGAIWSWTATSTIAALATFMLISRMVGGMTSPRAAGLARSVRHGWKILVAGQAIALQTSVAILLLGKTASSAEVGVFAIAIGLAAQVSSLCGTLAVVTSDRIAGPVRAASEEVVKRLGRTILALSIPVLILAALLAGRVIVTLYGAEYAASASLFVIMLAGHLVSQLTEIDSQFLIGQHWKTRDAMTLNLINMAIGFTLVFTLIPRFGATGAAIALSGGYIFNAIFHHAWVRRTMNCRWREMLLLTPSDFTSAVSALSPFPRTART